MIPNFNEYIALNESFKSKIISKLFKDGELETTSEREKMLFNQVTDDEILGVVDTEDEAKELIHNALGDMVVTRYEQRRVYVRCGEDDYDYDYEDDPNSAYKVNKTVEEYTNWVFKLDSGRYLVLRIEKSELDSRLDKIRFERERLSNRREKISDTRRKFLERKKFVEKNEKEIRKYWKFKRFLEKRGLLDDFIKTTNKELNKWFDSSVDDDTLAENNGKFVYDDCEINFTIGNYSFEIMADIEVTADISYWNEPGDYWHPGGEGYDVKNIDVSDISLDIAVIDAETEEEIFSLNYFPAIDKKSELCKF